MRPIKQSLAWWCYEWEGMDAVQFLKDIKAIGYAGVDFCPAQHYGACRDLGLELVLAIGHMGPQEGANKRANHARIEDELCANIEEAARWGIRVLSCFSGERYARVSDIEGAWICAEVIGKAAPLAEAKGITLGMELLNSRVDHGGYMGDRTEWGVLFCKLTASPAVKLVYDIYHMQIMEGDLIRTMQNNVAWIGHIHTAGNPGRHDLDETQEIYYPAIAKAIADLDYDGFVTHEFIPAVADDRKGDPLTALKTAYEMFAHV